jgi:AAA domain, putative AbiEii toxin, Type IV TA system
MLYVALTAQTTRFILLEEPNSFLHPRALRELLAILAEIGEKHQFFVTTHSSDVLRTINASTVTLLEHDGQQTKATQTDGSKLSSLRSGLIDLGVRLTDLHGCDRVLWVEGETEEAVFPLLLRHFMPEQAQGIAILPLHSTGDFESKKFKPSKVAEIYKTLSESSFLAPPMVGIALDSEQRKQSEIDQIEKDCKGLVHILPRPMLEDYFINATAIAHVLSEVADREVAIDEVTTAIAEASKHKNNCLNPKAKDSKPHAAKVLDAVFQKINNTLRYRKTLHGPQIAAWLLKHQPENFDELKDWFKKVVVM